MIGFINLPGTNTVILDPERTAAFGLDALTPITQPGAEQNSSMALGLADRTDHLVDDGRIVHPGPAAELETSRLLPV